MAKEGKPRGAYERKTGTFSIGYAFEIGPQVHEPKEELMDPFRLREFEAQLDDWLKQGYQILADEVEGQIRLTTVFVPRSGEPGKEREQFFWPLVPETVALLEGRAIVVRKATV